MHFIHFKCRLLQQFQYDFQVNVAYESETWSRSFLKLEAYRFFLQDWKCILGQLPQWSRARGSYIDLKHVGNFIAVKTAHSPLAVPERRFTPSLKQRLHSWLLVYLMAELTMGHMTNEFWPTWPISPLILDPRDPWLRLLTTPVNVTVWRLSAPIGTETEKFGVPLHSLVPSLAVCSTNSIMWIKARR